MARRGRRSSRWWLPDAYARHLSSTTTVPVMSSVETIEDFQHVATPALVFTTYVGNLELAEGILKAVHNSVLATSRSDGICDAANIKYIMAYPRSATRATLHLASNSSPMDFGLDDSHCQPTWSYAAQQNTVDEPASLFYDFQYGNVLNGHHTDQFPVVVLEGQPGYYPAWQQSPSASPTSSNSPTSSGSEEPMGNLAPSMQSFVPLDGSSRSTSCPPVPVHPHYSRPFPREPDPPVIHETFEVVTGEEEVVKAVIHRLTDEEKRGLSFTMANPRPTFCCKVQGCGRWLLHRAQVKPHLSEHGYRFCKPFKCSCGAEFGRQVEAARHVEDKKLCEHCHRSGRKYKGGAVCLRCLRRHGLAAK
ncbi:hypothetical protein JB92DRAFT_2846507 [Gautieria morchelliformis]|nr:hypothetical protein JB92DRAFT_2846507 [Gautieria morchelliformis]